MFNFTDGAGLAKDSKVCHLFELVRLGAKERTILGAEIKTLQSANLDLERRVRDLENRNVSAGTVQVDAKINVGGTGLVNA